MNYKIVFGVAILAALTAISSIGIPIAVPEALADSVEKNQQNQDNFNNQQHRSIFICACEYYGD